MRARNDRRASLSTKRKTASASNSSDEGWVETWGLQTTCQHLAPNTRTKERPATATDHPRGKRLPPSTMQHAFVLADPLTLQPSPAAMFRAALPPGTSLRTTAGFKRHRLRVTPLRSQLILIGRVLQMQSSVGQSRVLNLLAFN